MISPLLAKLYGIISEKIISIWIESEGFIIPIFKSGDTNNPSNYRTIMISPLLAKLYGIILEKKINILLESEGKQAKL